MYKDFSECSRTIFEDVAVLHFNLKKSKQKLKPWRIFQLDAISEYKELYSTLLM